MQDTAIAAAADRDLAAHDDGSPARLAINTLRTLAMDAVQKANSGTPRNADGAGTDRNHAVVPLPSL